MASGAHERSPQVPGGVNRDTSWACAPGFRSAGVALRRQEYTDDGSRRKRGAMSASSLRGARHAEVAMKHGQVTRALESSACAVLTNDRAEGG